MRPLPNYFGFLLFSLLFSESAYASQRSHKSRNFNSRKSVKNIVHINLLVSSINSTKKYLLRLVIYLFTAWICHMNFIKISGLIVRCYKIQKMYYYEKLTRIIFRINVEECWTILKWTHRFVMNKELFTLECSWRKLRWKMRKLTLDVQTNVMPRSIKMSLYKRKKAKNSTQIANNTSVHILG